MKVNTPEISWHAKDPIYSVDFQYVAGDIYRMATCGTDRNIRVMHVLFCLVFVEQDVKR